MAKRLLKRYGWWVLSVLLAVGLLSGFLLLPDAHAGKIVEPIEEPAFDTELYKSLLSKLVADETELVDQFNADYLMCYPLMPPAPDWQLTMEGGVIPYDKSSFPASWFLDELTPTSEMGVSCFSIILWLDPATWQTIVIDEITMKEVTALSVPAGFNMLDLIVEAWGEGILYGVDKEWVLSAYSPSRMAFRYRLFEKDDVDELVAEYSAAIAVTELASAPLKFAPMMLKYSSSSMEISDIENTGSGMEITIELPDGWSSTNSIDVFKTANLVSYWWSLLGTTNGSNTVTYTDTGSGDSDVELRFYRAGDGDTDTDSDGYVDARELLMYHSDPDNEDSYPVTVSGSVTHTNTPQTGLIHVVAVTASNSWDLGRFDDLSSPGSFEITGIPNLDDYWIKAWRDWCDNDQVDLWEATGMATNGPIYLTNSVSNIVITLTDPPASISGTLSYTGKQEGAWIAIVSTVETSWTASASCTAALSGFYHLSDLSQTSYYVKAWIDADEDSTCDLDSEAQGIWANNPIDLSNSVWDIDFELTDINGDGDSMPDWWEIVHFGNTNQTDAGDYDGDTMPNAWEYEWDFCPTNAADAMEDYDGDGYFNVYEYHHGTDPHNIGSVPIPGGSGGSSPTPSATVTVVTNGTPIQAALDQATNAYDIVLIEAGTYSGVSNCNLTFPSQPILLLGEDGAAATIIDCESVARGLVFTDSQSTHTAVSGLTIRNGVAQHGGGIYCSGASPTIFGCTVTANEAEEDGGGVYTIGGEPNIRTCTITANRAGDDAGGVRCKGARALIEDCRIEDNAAWSSGGGIYVDDGGTVTVSRTILHWNRSWGVGGGIRVSETGTYLVLRNTVLAGNTAAAGGGGLYAQSASRVDVESCTLVDNQAYTNSSAVDMDGSATVALSNTLLARNGDMPLAGTITNLTLTLTNATSSIVPGGWRLLPNSAAIDGGTNAAWMISALDVDGEPRIGDAVVDIGSDEFNDTDGDAMADAWEMNNFSKLDEDGTGDADQDGWSDAAEYAAGSDPMDALSAGDSDTLTLAVYVSDTTTGSSKSESYELRLDNGADSICITNAIGSFADAMHAFQKGTAYTVTLDHVATAYTNAPPPDYDHKATIGGLPTSSNGSHAEWTSGPGFLLHDLAGMLGDWYTDGHTTNFVAQGTNAVLYIINVNIVPGSSNVCSCVGTADFDLTASSYTPGGVTWSVDPPTAGLSIDGNGGVTFPDSAATYTVRATSDDDPACFDEATLTVLKDNSGGAYGDIWGGNATVTCPPAGTIMSTNDACGNTLELICDGAQFLVKYNGAVIAQCVYHNGLNSGNYRWTADGCRFHSVYWLNVDDSASGIPGGYIGGIWVGGDDEGTLGVYDGTEYKYDCMNPAVSTTWCFEGPTQSPIALSSVTSTCE